VLRILFLGENWFGSCARACCYALRRAGCEVADIDIQTIAPQWRRLRSRGLARLLRPLIIREYNQLILNTARNFRPDILLAFKGSLVESRSLHVLRSWGIKLYNYYPDTSPFAHDWQLAQSILEYDCIFHTKKFWFKSPPAGIDQRRLVYVAHGYDPDVHRPASVSIPPIEHNRPAVLVIAGHSAEKERLLSSLVRSRPKLDLAIYGPRWNECSQSENLKPFVRGYALYGAEYARAISSAAICLGILSGHVQGVCQGDEVTTRSFEIPACAGFMLHQRTSELLEHYREGQEVSCFASIEELNEKIDYYLARPEERRAIARAGHKRCVPAYSYDRRMAEILRWHEQAKRIVPPVAATRSA